MNTPTPYGRFPSAALTERQLDGIACVRCGVEFGPGAVSVPAGIADHGQIFACAHPCVPEPAGR